MERFPIPLYSPHMTRAEKAEYIFKVFLFYPSVIESLVKYDARKDHHSCDPLNATRYYGALLRSLAEAKRDEDPFIRHFAKTTYRAVLDAGTDVLH